MIRLTLLVLVLSLSGSAQIAPSVAVPDLTFADAIDYLTDFSLMHHTKDWPFTGTHYAYTDLRNREIHILEQNRFDKRDSLIHEMLHIKCYAESLPCTEEAIVAKTAEMYKRIFLRE